MSVLNIANPATGETIDSLDEMSCAKIDGLIQAAHEAQKEWARRTAEERGTALLRWYDLIAENQERLARILTAEEGKPLAEARAEIAYANSFIKWFAAEAPRAYGLAIPTPFSNAQVSALKEPVGVVAAITPWNFPAAMVTRKVAPALAAGCSVLVKPSGLTPLTALALERLAHQAGIPEGVFANIISADAAEVGKTLTSHPMISKISFTGSSRVGSILMAQSAPTVKRISLELGGNAPFLVFADACMDTAVEAAIIAKLRNCGQTCVSANRFLVERTVADEFAERLSLAFASLQMGDGDDPETKLGPLVEERATQRVRALVIDATNAGADTVGEPNAQSDSLGPAFARPSVLSNVTPSMRVFQEEVFGPVAPVTTFETENEAVHLANATPFGLAGYLCTQDRKRIARVTRAMECGMIGINTGVISNAAIPFGGCKQSGIGREGSAYGLDEYLEVKALVEAV